MKHNEFISDKYEIFYSTKYLVIKDVLNNHYLRVTGHIMKYIIQNISDENLQEFLYSLFSSNNFEHKRKVISIELNNEKSSRMLISYIPNAVFDILVMTFTIICALIFGGVFIYCEGICADYNYVYSGIWIVVNIFIHELGHYIVCIKSGRSVRSFGVKFNYGLPMMYVDTIDICMSKMTCRLATSLAGIYFNAILSLLLLSMYLLNNLSIFLFFSQISLFFVASNLVPFLKLDGYYVVADLLGENNLDNASKNAMKKILSGTLCDRHEYILVLYGILRWVFIMILLLSIWHKIYCFLLPD